MLMLPLYDFSRVENLSSLSLSLSYSHTVSTTLDRLFFNHQI